MRENNKKVRLQWNWFRSALIGLAIGILIAPAIGGAVGSNSTERTDKEEKKQNPVETWVNGIFLDGKIKVKVNGNIVALAKKAEDGEKAFRSARLAYNANGIRILDVEVTFEPIDKEKDKETIKGMKVLEGEALTDAILASFDSYADTEKELAYTMRVDDYTVTVDSMQDLLGVLEEAQTKYDPEDAFAVTLNSTASRNVTMYEVGVEQREDASATAKDENGNKTSAQEGVDEQGSTQEEKDSDVENLPQAADDGIKYVGFADVIQVVETYADNDRIKDKDSTYQDIVAEKQEATTYVVQSGDYLALIADKYNMTEDELKEINPGIQSDDDLYYDDRLNVRLPRTMVQIQVEKQETYRETYNEDVVYEDDADMYIGETEVVQEGTPGTHIVTDMVTYKDDMEYKREQLQETVEVAAVPEIVKRGTKSHPTYMYPLSTWMITSTFGYRWGRLHAGVDVGVPIGTTVRASRGGQVITAGWVGGYGNCVMIDHGDGVVTLYGHLNEFTVSVGQYVDQGQQIAMSGNTGHSTGPHLHFEIRVNGTPTDPLPYLN